MMLLLNGFSFATGHGKSLCYGLGIKVRRFTAQATLKRIVIGQILNVDRMFEFGETNLKNIKFIMLQKTTFNSTLKSR